MVKGRGVTADYYQSHISNGWTASKCSV